MSYDAVDISGPASEGLSGSDNWDRRYGHAASWQRVQPQRERRSDGGGQRCPLLPFLTPPFPAQRLEALSTLPKRRWGCRPLAVDMCRYPVRWRFTREENQSFQNPVAMAPLGIQ